MQLQVSSRKFESNWIRTVLLLAILVIAATSVIDAQQFPVPNSSSSSGVAGTQMPDERFANGGMLSAGSSSGSENLWRTMQALGAIFVIAGIGIGGFFLLRKYAPGAIPGKDARMKVLMRMPMGTRQNITVVKVGERVLVVGASSGRMDCLSVITDPQEVEALSYGVEFTREIDRVHGESPRPKLQLPSESAPTEAGTETVHKQTFESETFDRETLDTGTFDDTESFEDIESFDTVLDTGTIDTTAEDSQTAETASRDVRHEIEWLRERLEGFGESVEGEVKK
ncbi:MAG: flagellar biosynthetic protein FliO [Planctomycetota bacterium]|nr:flagellar biosynthetic protein FliO [Planctomycetota bacterium]